LQLLKNGIQVIGIDNKNNYYNIHLKQARLKELKQYDNFIFLEEDISDKQKVMELFADYKPNLVVNLAAQAGIRYSIEHQDVYLKRYIIGFYHNIAACRHYAVCHLIYAY